MRCLYAKTDQNPRKRQGVANVSHIATFEKIKAMQPARREMDRLVVLITKVIIVFGFQNFLENYFFVNTAILHLLVPRRKNRQKHQIFPAGIRDALGRVGGDAQQVARTRGANDVTGNFYFALAGEGVSPVFRRLRRRNKIMFGCLFFDFLE